MTGEVDGRANHDETEIARDRHCDHITIDDLTQSNPPVVSLGDDVDWLVAHHQVEPDVLVFLKKAGEQRAAQITLARTRHVEAERTPRLVTQLADSGHRGSQLFESRTR